MDRLYRLYREHLPIATAPSKTASDRWMVGQMKRFLLESLAVDAVRPLSDGQSSGQACAGRHQAQTARCVESTEQKPDVTRSLHVQFRARQLSSGRRITTRLNNSRRRQVAASRQGRRRGRVSGIGKLLTRTLRSDTLVISRVALVFHRSSKALSHRLVTAREGGDQKIKGRYDSSIRVGFIHHHHSYHVSPHSPHRWAGLSRSWKAASR